MNVEEYEWIVFQHKTTGRIGTVRMEFMTDKCDYYYRNANPLVYMDITKEEANKKFASGEWIPTAHRRFNANR
jgi:hypothetical protein